MIVRWEDSESIDTRAGKIRLRVYIEGVRPEDVKVYAVYLTNQ